MRTRLAADEGCEWEAGMDLRWSDDAHRTRGNEDLRLRTTAEEVWHVLGSSGVVSFHISVVRASCEPVAWSRVT
jgi:hypothetical protein